MVSKYVCKLFFTFNDAVKQSKEQHLASWFYFNNDVDVAT